MNDTLLLLVMILAALLYYGAFACYLLKKKKRFGEKRLFAYLPMLLWCAGAAANLTVILNNFFRNGYVPFVSMFQVLTFLSVCFLPVFLYMTYVCRCKDCGAYFSLASAIVMTGPCFMREGSVWTFPPALQSPWFVPHILMYMIAYSLGTVAFLMTLVYLFKRSDGAFRAIYCCERTLFPFMSAGMFFGAIWADQIWGGFWGWDLKECWSLVTWMIYMLSLHFARREKLKRFVPLATVLGFAAIIVTMFFVGAMVSGGGVSSNHVYST